MSREAGLFDEANGSPLRGYLLLKSRRGRNIPPNWIVRSRKSRKGREKDVATAFKKSKRARMTTPEGLGTGVPQRILLPRYSGAA
jgi:hypothetical protein